MVILEKYQICVICPPHTGTRTLHTLFEENKDHVGYVKVRGIHQREVPRKYRNYECVSCCRNPFDRLVAIYHDPWFQRLRLTWSAFVKRVLDCNFRLETSRWSTLPVVRFLGKTRISEFIRFEFFENDVRLILPVPEEATIPVIGGPSKSANMVRWSPEDRDRVVEWAQCDFDRFGYSTVLPRGLIDGST